MKIPACVTILCSLFLAGCLAHHADREMLTRQVDVFGVELYSGTDYREIGGVTGTEEPCLRGYERSFDPLEITVGYGFDKRVRKITTRNPGTSLFGVKPGMTAEEGIRLVRQAGLADAGRPFTFRGGGFTLALLVDGAGRVFGVTVEVDD